MSALPEPILNLVVSLSKLPGIGPRSAERIALHIVHSETVPVEALATAIRRAREKVSLCGTCGGLTEQQPCVLCADPRRDSSIVCVVERPVDIFSIGKAAIFKGVYHVLGGKISPLNGIEPEDLRIAELERRCDSGQIKEIIVALSSDVEGEATSFYLNTRLSPRGIRITRIAHGLPVGSGLEFADELTLGRAMEGRRQIT